MASIQDVASLAGVHRSTVSRIINGEGKFRSDTRRKVEQAMATLNYRPSAIARSLATASSNMTGLLVTYYTGGFFGEMMEQVQNELDLHKKFLITAQGHHSADGEREAIDRFHALRCEGYVLNSRYLSDDELRELAAESTPFVLLDRLVEGLEDRCITFDHTLAAKMAVQHLIQQGHRNIACISGPMDRISSQQRYQGYLLAMQEAGLPVNPGLTVFGDYKRESGYQAVRELYQTGMTFSALFSCNEEMMLGAVLYFHEHAIDIPRQVALISFDSVDLCQGLYPPVSEVYFPLSEMAQSAVKLLISKINDTSFWGPQHFAPQLRLR
ncbi:LacI family DNA-binding transcriptional regulator [Photobacterium ganghwense]|uniref:LacI family transcriptional regulator n=1 Tax=Photobacterium ganghwense TaxID=320778 RepID=A0A0J1HI25_9GAMM|nr:LacI family DNA-binding transcriptional regulator [Photobacterium ganghwense]KLV11258.1 LacI family transcriptional regulator [Photobacterium ganghwense]PSU05113.1 LacI family DNA-binding transcriptional regulator [Photobacterium ganghwense]QSV13725.1 LacI family DNA-binding transcriptional regulator [Photobacterium ganghwense]